MACSPYVLQGAMCFSYKICSHVYLRVLCVCVFCVCVCVCVFGCCFCALSGSGFAGEAWMMRQMEDTPLLVPSTEPPLNSSGYASVLWCGVCVCCQHGKGVLVPPTSNTHFICCYCCVTHMWPCVCVFLFNSFRSGPDTASQFDPLHSSIRSQVRCAQASVPCFCTRGVGGGSGRAPGRRGASTGSSSAASGTSAMACSKCSTARTPSER